MEADWERTEAHVELDLPAAQRLLAPLGLDPHALTLIAEGKVNTNYRVDTSDGSVHLRLHHGSDEKVEMEAALAERLHGVVPVPRLLARGARFLVFEWLPGLSLERALGEGRPLPYERIARQLAQVRLALNDVGFPHYGFLNPDISVHHDWNTAVGAFFGHLHRLLEPPTVDHTFAARAEEIADLAEPRLRALEGPPVLVHGDFKPTNLLVDERGLVGVVDWEFAHAGTFLADVGQLMRHPETLPEGFASAFSGALGLDDDVLLLARTLDLANLVDLRRKYLPGPGAAREAIERRVYRVCDLYEARFGT